MSYFAVEAGPPFIKRRYRVTVTETLQEFDGILDCIALDYTFPSDAESEAPPFRLRIVLTRHEVDAQTEQLLECLADEIGPPELDREYRWRFVHESNGRLVKRTLAILRWHGEDLPFSFHELEA